MCSGTLPLAAAWGATRGLLETDSLQGLGVEGSAEKAFGARAEVEVARAKWRGGRRSPGGGEAVCQPWEEEGRLRRVFQEAIFRFESSLELSVF